MGPSQPQRHLNLDRVLVSLCLCWASLHSATLVVGSGRNRGDHLFFFVSFSRRHLDLERAHQRPYKLDGTKCWPSLASPEYGFNSIKDIIRARTCRLTARLTAEARAQLGNKHTSGSRWLPIVQPSVLMLGSLLYAAAAHHRRATAEPRRS